MSARSAGASSLTKPNIPINRRRVGCTGSRLSFRRRAASTSVRLAFSRHAVPDFERVAVPGLPFGIFSLLGTTGMGP